MESPENPIFNLSVTPFFVPTPPAEITGIVISGIWASDRPYMITLVPNKNSLGQYLGYHAVTGRLASIFGPFSWGFISTTLGLGQIPAVLTLAVFSLISLAFILGFRNKK